MDYRKTINIDIHLHILLDSTRQGSPKRNYNVFISLGLIFPRGIFEKILNNKKVSSIKAKVRLELEN